MPDFDSAIADAMPLAKAAAKAGAHILFLPEYCGGLREDGPVLVPPSAPEAEHPVLAKLSSFASDNGVWISVGSIAVSGPNDKILNRGYMLDDQGNIRGHYDKINLFDVQITENEGYRESARVIPGREATVFDTPFGQIGHSICYDLRFPQLYRALAQAGAEILCIPAAFNNITGQAHWHVLNRARAIENGAYVVSACAIGPIEGGTEAYGHSLIVDPWGEVLADGGEEPGIVLATLDLDKVAEARARIPSLRHDRTFSIKQEHQRNIA
jgi:predicted amidohydrolase